MTRTMALLALGIGCKARIPDTSDASNAPPPPADNPEADADTDADSDADTAPPEDTGPAVAWAGEYEGRIGASITYQESTLIGVQIYQCTGPFDVSVTSASPGIYGEGICAGDLSGYPEIFQMTLTGDVSAFPLAGGTLTVVHEDFTFDDLWVGTFEADELDADATDMIAGEPTINWYVNFTVER